MRTLIQHCAAFCADRLTLQERWLVVGFVGITVLGAFVKYARARPDPRPSSPPTAMPSLTSSTEDQR